MLLSLDDTFSGLSESFCNCQGILRPFLSKKFLSHQPRWWMLVYVGFLDGGSSGWIPRPKDWPEFPSILCRLGLFSKPSSFPFWTFNPQPMVKQGLHKHHPPPPPKKSPQVPKIKFNCNGNIGKYKAILVAKEFVHTHTHKGFTSIRILLSIVATMIFIPRPLKELEE